MGRWVQMSDTVAWCRWWIHLRVSSFHIVSFRCSSGVVGGRLLRQHLLDLLVAEVDLVHGVSALLEWHVVVVAERGDKDLGVPDEALPGREIRDLVARQKM